MRIMNGRQAWLRRGITGIGLAAPLALAPALPVTVPVPAPAAEIERMEPTVDVSEVESDPGTAVPAQRPAGRTLGRETS